MDDILCRDMMINESFNRSNLFPLLSIFTWNSGQIYHHSFIFLYLFFRVFSPREPRYQEGSRRNA